MIYKYEMACREAGLSEEKTAEIRRMFDAEYKKLKRRKKRQEEENFYWLSMNAGCGQEDDSGFDIPDPDTDVEEEVVHPMTLQDLRRYMADLSDEDREFLYGCFGDYPDPNVRMARKYGLTVNQVLYKKKQLILQLRKRFERG